MSQFLKLGPCGSSDFIAECPNSPYGTKYVHNRYKMYTNRHKHTQSFYVVRQLSMSMVLCLDAKIFTDLIQGLQLVLRGTRLPFYPRPFLKLNHL